MKKNGEYVKFSDALIDYRIEGKPRNLSSTVYVPESRAFELKSKDDDQIDFDATSFLNIQDEVKAYDASEIKSFMNKDNQADYNFTLRLIRDEQGKELEIIEASPKSGVQKLLTEGTVIFDPKSNLILEVNYVSSPLLQQYGRELNLLGIKIKLIGGEVHYKYQLADDNYYMYYSKKSIVVTLSSKRFQYELGSLSDLLVNSISPNTESLNKQDKYSKKSLYKRGTNYRTEFWKTSNSIRLTDKEEAVIEKLK